MDFRATQNDLERARLAPWATPAAASRGRRFAEPDHPLRTAFQRDRDRIIHSRAFRRLEYKTQVYVAGTNDHFRTRLTHTIEVAGIARTIARSLGLNEDLAEAISLAHDLGHPPFGHCGERTLHALLQAHGGFDHNRQALRVVDELEEKYPGIDGLNLTWELRSGLLKHRQPTPPTLDGERLPPQPSLEAQTADVADDLTYYSHDLDDGLNAGLLREADLAALPLWQRVRERAGARARPGDRCYFPFLVRTLIDLLVEDVVRTREARLRAAPPASADAVQHLPAPLLGFSPATAAHCRELCRFLFEKMYWHSEVLHDNEEAVKYVAELYHHFIAHPEALGRRAQQRVARVGLVTAVADYLAGMTDRYALEQYEQFLGRAADEGAAPATERAPPPAPAAARSTTSSFLALLRRPPAHPLHPPG